MHIAKGFDLGARDPAASSGNRQNSPAANDAAFLSRLGERVRDARARRGLTRKDLARDSQVSERYLAQLEARPRQHFGIAAAPDRRGARPGAERLLLEEEEQPVELTLIHQLLQRLPKQRLARIRARLQARVRQPRGRAQPAHRADRIARRRQVHAGRRCWRRKLGVAFIELDREIEREAGTGLSEIFLLYGQQGYRRYERRCLEKALEAHERCVIATGGSIVSEPGTYDLLLSTCFTVWLKAEPEEHMARVVAQGDTRPMAGNAQAMEDLRRILRWTRHAVRASRRRRGYGRTHRRTKSADAQKVAAVRA